MSIHTASIVLSLTASLLALGCSGKLDVGGADEASEDPADGAAPIERPEGVILRDDDGAPPRDEPASPAPAPAPAPAPSPYVPGVVTVTGTVDGEPVTLAAAIAYEGENRGMRIALEETTKGLGCAYHIPVGSSKAVWFDVPFGTAAGTTLPAKDAVRYIEQSARCTSSGAEVASGGTITITSVGETFAGPLDVTFANGSLQGSFEITPCNVPPVGPNHCL